LTERKIASIGSVVAVGHLQGLREPVRQAEAAQTVRVGEHGQRMGLQRPEPTIVVEVLEGRLDRPPLCGSGPRRPELFDGLGGEVLERDPVRLRLRSYRRGRQVDGDELGPARLQEQLDLALWAGLL
jgi:hypothetical protein